MLRTSMSKNKYRETLRFIQLTDIHLFSERDKTLVGVNTYESFHAVISEIKSRNTEFDYMLMTGDLSQDKSLMSYQHLASALACWHKPCLWLVGNHDHPDYMQKAMCSPQFKHDRHVLLGEKWQALILNSQVKDKTHGHLDREQLDFIKETLSANPERFTIVLLHHHPVFVGSEWLDQHSLRNNDEFWQVLTGFSQVKGIICGHVHQDLDLEHQGCRVLGSPSTCIQFLPNSSEFTLDDSSPGWREITLHADGSIDTRVERIESDRFKADLKSSGY